MENLTGGNPPVRPLPCVVPCKLYFTNGYKFFVTIALSGVGFKIKFKELFTKGLKPIALGGCTWLALFLSSLTFASLFAEKMLG